MRLCRSIGSRRGVSRSALLLSIAAAAAVLAVVVSVVARDRFSRQRPPYRPPPPIESPVVPDEPADDTRAVSDGGDGDAQPTGSDPNPAPGEGDEQDDGQGSLSEGFMRTAMDELGNLGETPHPLPTHLFETLYFAATDFDDQQFTRADRQAAIMLLSAEYAQLGPGDTIDAWRAEDRLAELDAERRRARILDVLLDASQSEHPTHRAASIFGYTTEGTEPGPAMAGVIRRLRNDPADVVAYTANTIVLEGDDREP